MEIRETSGDQVDNLSNHQLQASSEIRLAGNIKYDYVWSENGEIQFAQTVDVSKVPKN